MKKVAAILLILMLSFNWYGYRIVTAMLAENADLQLEQQLDNNEYDEASLIEIRLTLNVPYQNSQADFERHYGEVEVDGKYYTYVKSKVSNGELILKCIPNSTKEMIKQAGNDYFKTASGLDHNKADKNSNQSGFAKNFWSEYDDRDNNYELNVPGVIAHQRAINSGTSLYNTALPLPGQPPEYFIG